MSDNRLKIGVDLDGVVANWTHNFSLICEQLFGRTFPRTAMVWDLHDWPLSSEEFKQAWAYMCAEPFFYNDLPAMKDVADFDMHLFAQRHRLYFITTRPVTVGEPMEIQSARWLRDKFGLQYPTVLVTESKGAVVAALGLDAFIDDKPENLADIANQAPSCRLFLRHAEYNKNADEVLALGSYERVASFQQFNVTLAGIAIERAVRT